MVLPKVAHCFRRRTLFITPSVHELLSPCLLRRMAAFSSYLHQAPIEISPPSDEDRSGENPMASVPRTRIQRASPAPFVSHAIRRGNVPKVPQERSDRNSSLPGDAARRARLPSERGMNNRPPLINTAHAHEFRLERRQLRPHQPGILFEPGPQSLEVLLHELLVGRPFPLVAL